MATEAGRRIRVLTVRQCIRVGEKSLAASVRIEDSLAVRT